MAPDTEATGGRDMRRRAWRWHFLAALLVIPFVLWQSATGTLYLWSEAWVDQRHPDLRFVEPAPRQVSLDVQLRAARDFQPGAKVANWSLPKYDWPAPAATISESYEATASASWNR